MSMNYKLSEEKIKTRVKKLVISVGFEGMRHFQVKLFNFFIQFKSVKIKIYSTMIKIKSIGLKLNPGCPAPFSKKL